MNTAFDIQALKNLFYNYVWKSATDQRPFIQQRLITSLRIGHLIIRDLLEGMITLRAMGLVYTTILALVPLLAVSFSVLKGFGVHNQVEPLLLNLLQPLGEKGIEISQRIIGFVDNIKAGVLGSLGLLLLMYTVVSLLQKIEKSFNYTWRVEQHRPLAQRFSEYLSIILIGPVLLFSALGMTASVLNMRLIQEAMEIEAIGMLISFFAHLIPYMLVIAAFTFVYILIPNIRVKFKSALVGAVVAGVLWETTSWIFAAFIVNSAKYTAIYSAFASMIIFFIWLYMNWLILLIGCSIASYHQQPALRTLRPRVVRLSNRMRETMSLTILVLVARHYHEHKAPWHIETLAKYMNVDIDVCELLVNQLMESHLLVATTDTPASYLPAYDPATLSLNDIVLAIRELGESDYLGFDRLKHEPVVDELFTDMESALSRSLNNRSLADLITSDIQTIVVDTGRKQSG